MWPSLFDHLIARPTLRLSGVVCFSAILRYNAQRQLGTRVVADQTATDWIDSVCFLGIFLYFDISVFFVLSSSIFISYLSFCLLLEHCWLWTMLQTIYYGTIYCVILNTESIIQCKLLSFLLWKNNWPGFVQYIIVVYRPGSDCIFILSLTCKQSRSLSLFTLSAAYSWCIRYLAWPAKHLARSSFHELSLAKSCFCSQVYTVNHKKVAVHLWP